MSPEPERRESAPSAPSLPLPPLDYRQWVGPVDAGRYDNPDGRLVYPEFPPERYESVFDFGCGCGRIARQLIQQRPRPSRYVGIDVHPDLIRWCSRNLTPAAPDFGFVHHDVFDMLVNADPAKPELLPLPVPDESVTLFEALSIFTHVVERHLAFYLGEAARVLRPDGEINASFLTFEKAVFPALGPRQNALYLSDTYPPAGVYYDRRWLQGAIEEAGLSVVRVASLPECRGYQMRLVLARRSEDLVGLTIPVDEQPIGVPGDAPVPAESDQCAVAQP